MNILGFNVDKAEAKAKETVEKSWVGSSRAIFCIAFIAFLYFAKSLFTTELFIIAASVVGLYMLCNTVTRIFEVREEGKTIRERQRLAWTDGVLTDAEARALESADRIAERTSATPAIPTPGKP
jgi:hypothetical protein